MKTYFLKISPVLLLVLAILGSCEDSLLPSESSSTLSALSSSSCGGSLYADSVYYYREQSTPYIISPVTAQAGTYSAFPDGLSINPTTGAINVNQSESGLKYRVSFLPTGATDSCTTFVIISGVNYLSAIYDLSASNTLAMPYYNAQRNLAPPCDDDDDEEEDGDDDDGGCEFDDGNDDDDGDGTADEPPAGQQVRPLGIDIDIQNGIINLQQTVLNGTFGATPVSGSSRTVRIYYRISDASNKALNYIDVQFHYYDTYANIPASLLADMDDKNGATLRSSAVKKTKPVRPPHIVIMRSYQ
jgi:hypothetical protein